MIPGNGLPLCRTSPAESAALSGRCLTDEYNSMRVWPYSTKNRRSYESKRKSARRPAKDADGGSCQSSSCAATARCLRPTSGRAPWLSSGPRKGSDVFGRFYAISRGGPINSCSAREQALYARHSSLLRLDRSAEYPRQRPHAFRAERYCRPLPLRRPLAHGHYRPFL